MTVQVSIFKMNNAPDKICNNFSGKKKKSQTIKAVQSESEISVIMQEMKAMEN